MTALTTASALFIALVALEYLLWLSPLAPACKRLRLRMGPWFDLLPYHYLLRLALLGLALLFGQAPAWPPFSGDWPLSLLLGLGMMTLTYIVAAALGFIDRERFWQEARTWLREQPGDFAGNALYLLVYPGFGEEILFRWYCPAVLFPVVGWWTLLLAPVINLIWHLPVYIDMVGGRLSGLRAIAGPVLGPAVFNSLLFTAACLVVHDLTGVIFAHAFSDWIGSVQRRVQKRRQLAVS